MRKKLAQYIYITFIALLAGVVSVYAGSLTPPGSTSATFYTLDDIYTRLTTNVAATEGDHTFTTPGSASATFHTLTQIYNAIPTVYAGDLLASSTYLGVTGSVTVKTGDTTVASSSAQGTSLVFTIPQGYYSGASSVTVSTSSSSFTAANIKSGTYLFGVTGTAYPAQPLVTGQTVCYDSSGSVVSCSSTGQDGDALKGASRSFTDNGDGTITDNVTGLIWQKQDDATTRTWDNALAYCNNNTAGLSGSGWRLPNIRELESIVDFSVNTGPSINGTYFPSTQQNFYWTATTYQLNIFTSAWKINFNTGGNAVSAKSGTAYVRCVRGG